jgi:hypothetical protein
MNDFDPVLDDIEDMITSNVSYPSKKKEGPEINKSNKRPFLAGLEDDNSFNQKENPSASEKEARLTGELNEEMEKILTEMETYHNTSIQKLNHIGKKLEKGIGTLNTTTFISEEEYEKTKLQKNTERYATTFPPTMSALTDWNKYQKFLTDVVNNNIEIEASVVLRDITKANYANSPFYKMLVETFYDKITIQQQGWPFQRNSSARTLTRGTMVGFQDRIQSFTDEHIQTLIKMLYDLKNYLKKLEQKPKKLNPNQGLIRTPVESIDDQILYRDSSLINRDTDLINRDTDLINRDTDLINRDTDLIDFADYDRNPPFKNTTTQKIEILDDPNFRWHLLSETGIRVIKIKRIVTKKNGDIETHEQFISLSELLSYNSFQKIGKINIIGDRNIPDQSDDSIAFSQTSVQLPATKTDGVIPFNILIASFKAHQFGIKTDLSRIVSQKIKRGVFDHQIYELFKSEISKQFDSQSDIKPFAEQLKEFYTQNDVLSNRIHGLLLPIIRTEDSFHDFINLQLTIYGIISNTIDIQYKAQFHDTIHLGATKAGFADQGKLRAKSYDTLKEIFQLLSGFGVYIPPFLGEVQYLSQYQYDQYIFKLMFVNTNGFTRQSLIFNGEGGRIIDGVDTFKRVKGLNEDDLSLFFDELQLDSITFEGFNERIKSITPELVLPLVLEPDIPSNKIDGASDQIMAVKTMCTRSRITLSPQILCELVSLGINNPNAGKRANLYFHYIILYFSNNPTNMVVLDPNLDLSLPRDCIVIGIYFIQGKLSVNMCAEKLEEILGIDVREALRGEGKSNSKILNITILQSFEIIQSLKRDTDADFVDGCINYIRSICMDVSYDDYHNIQLPFCIEPISIDRDSKYATFLGFSNSHNITYADIFSALISSGKFFGDAGFCIQGSRDRHLQYLSDAGNSFLQVEPSKRIASGTPDHLLYLMHLGLVLSGNGSEIFTIISKGQTSYKMWKGLVDEAINPDVLINSGILNVLEARAVLKHILKKPPQEIVNVLSFKDDEIEQLLIYASTVLDRFINELTGEIINDSDRTLVRHMIDTFEFKRIQKCIDDVFTEIQPPAKISHFTDGYYGLVKQTQLNTRKKLTHYLHSILTTITNSVKSNIFKNMSTTPSLYPALSSELWRALEASEPSMMSDFTEVWGSYDGVNITVSEDEAEHHIGFHTFFISEETIPKLLIRTTENPKIIDITDFFGGQHSTPSILTILKDDENGFGIYEKPATQEGKDEVTAMQEEDEVSESVTDMEGPQPNDVVNTEEVIDIKQPAIQNSLLVVFCYDKDLKSPYTEFTTYGSKDISLLETINIKNGRQVVGYIEVLRINYFGTEMLFELLNDEYQLLSIAQKKRILQVIAKQQYELAYDVLSSAYDVLSSTISAKEHALNFMGTIRTLLKLQNPEDTERELDEEEIEEEFAGGSTNGGVNRMNKGDDTKPNIVKNNFLNNNTRKTHTIQKNKRSNRRIRKLGVYTRKRNRKPLIKNKRKTNRRKTKTRRSISNRK